MQLEFHQLDRRWEHLRALEPARQRRLLASLAGSGQQTPIVVVLSTDGSERYLVIDGYKRIAALEQLGRDTVEATLWPMSEAEALLLSRSLQFSPRESALEQGWLLARMEESFGAQAVSRRRKNAAVASTTFLRNSSQVSACVKTFSVRHSAR
jgi:ParB family transcriptional regulator, chromosome partitioning protein